VTRSSEGAIGARRHALACISIQRYKMLKLPLTNHSLTAVCSRADPHRIIGEEHPLRKAAQVSMNVRFVYANFIATCPRAGVFHLLGLDLRFLSIAFHRRFIGDSSPPVSFWLRGRGDRYPRFPKLSPVPAALFTGLPWMRVLGNCCNSCRSSSQHLRRLLFAYMLPHVQIVGRGKDPRSKLGYRGRREPVVQPATRRS
jgi:hypothetical protein